MYISISHDHIIYVYMYICLKNIFPFIPYPYYPLGLQPSFLLQKIYSYRK